jgi:hypothetical protein
MSILLTRPAVDIAAFGNRTAAAAAAAFVFRDLRVVHRTQRAQVVEPVLGRWFALPRARDDVVDMGGASGTTRHGAAVAVTR